MLVKDFLSQKEYREREELSASDIKQLLDNPYKFKIGAKIEETQSMKLGTLAHCLVLEPYRFNEIYAVAPEVDKRTKDGKEIWEAFNGANKNKIVIDRAMHDTAQGIYKSLNDNGLLHAYFTNGKVEVSYLESELFGVKFKARPDFISEDGELIVDLKCVSDSSPKGFQRLCANLRYYIQAYLYLKITGAKRFVFVAVETKEPHTIGIYELDYIALEFAEKEVLRALDILKDIKSQKNIYTLGDLQAKILTLPNYVFYDGEA